MARKTTSPQQDLPKPSLTVSRSEAESKIQARVDIGDELFKRHIMDPQHLDEARSENRKWHDYNRELLGVIFDNEKFAKEYENNSHAMVYSMGYSSFSEDVSEYRESVKRKLDLLESIKERIELMKEPSISDEPEPTIGKITKGNTVFIVHGHDETLKEQTARVISELGLKPVILHEKENQGKTLIEKFEHNAKKSAYAIVLLTPDDVGRAESEKDDRLEKRARQNVVFEMGYFVGLLGRQNTCALYKSNVRLPSDIDGIVYVQVTEGDEGWKLSVARELKSAGFNIDMNNL